MRNLVASLILLSGIAMIGPASYAQDAVTTSGGTANAVPKFSNATTLTNSAINEVGGNVGIGTTTPAFNLHVSGSAANVIGNMQNAQQGAYWAVTTPTVPTNVYRGFLGSDGTNNHFLVGQYANSSEDMIGFYTGPSISEKMRILNSGNVGIGSTIPRSELTLGSISDPSPNPGPERYYSNGGLTFQTLSPGQNYVIGRVAPVQEVGQYSDRSDITSFDHCNWTEAGQVHLFLITHDKGHCHA